MAGKDVLINKKDVYVFGTTVKTKSLRGRAWMNDEKCKWFFPFFFAGVGFYCQSVGLHWATYQYIHKYGAAPEDYRTLYDSIEPDPAEAIDMATIDKIAGLIPMLFMVITAFTAFPSCSKRFAAVTSCCSRPTWAYLVDNSALQAPTTGLVFRNSKSIDNMDADMNAATWGTIVYGSEETGGWVKVGNAFLPMKLQGVTVLKLQLPKEFKVVIDNRTGPGLGVQWDGSDDLRIKAVMSGGLVEQWNKTHRDFAVEPGDRIVEANEIRNDVLQMVGELDRNKELKLLVQRHQRRSERVHPRHDFLLRQNVLRIWTKVMTCATLLFMLKGILGAITVVPDSSGWNVCENRLKKDGMEWMRQNHSFYDMLSIDAMWVSEHHTPLRYCADMMFSGHTFVVTLFALGTYEMMRAFRFDIVYQEMMPSHLKWKAIVKMSVLIIYACFIIFEQVVEIWFVERSHFHYSSDVFMAIILTFLIYTNGVIAVFAKHWTTWGLLIFSQWRQAGHQIDKQSGDISNVKLADVWHSPENTTDFYTTDPKKKEWALLNSRGDIFIPPCCFPFCFYAGREHVYSDEGIMDIVRNSHAFTEADKSDNSHVIRDYLQNTMMLDEGVSMSDVRSVKRMIYEGA